MTPYYLKCIDNKGGGTWIDLSSVVSIREHIDSKYPGYTYWLESGCYGADLYNKDGYQVNLDVCVELNNDFIEAWKKANTKSTGIPADLSHTHPNTEDCLKDIHLYAWMADKDVWKCSMCGHESDEI